MPVFLENFLHELGVDEEGVRLHRAGHEHAGGIEDRAATTRACEQMEVVFHTAAKAGGWGDPREYEATNVVGTENVIAGCVAQFGPQGLHIARNAWLQQGFPIETSATTIDLQCGSAQQLC